MRKAAAVQAREEEKQVAAAWDLLKAATVWEGRAISRRKQKSPRRLHASAAWRKGKVAAQMGKGDAAAPEHTSSPCTAAVLELK